VPSQTGSNLFALTSSTQALRKSDLIESARVGFIESAESLDALETDCEDSLDKEVFDDELSVLATDAGCDEAIESIDKLDDKESRDDPY
jgi:hypothetical protein